ncbi:MAG: molybdate ABC transporter substrate-binding protein [Lentisphaerae bacterium RIFOXYB12_FULL_65_16]|nr:MAG: molybdate ABC transporter substrate-binding protein [Lentisphaerae bacterium RIFOXYA12_64_32]OGV87424.1 MAG: molybdate ABC transporter substrate-binding protein [Lentisphaerae bacterium RIFOXYB12_FULL_65_16]
MQFRLQILQIATGALLTLLMLTGCGRHETAAPRTAGLTVFVPCGMELPFTAAKREFEAANPGTPVVIVLDNANILVKRVEKGERPDLIVSPGTVEMERLVSLGKVQADSVSHFGRYELVLFAPRSNPANIATIADLLKPEVKVLAIADPELNSVGRYTREALEKLGLWETLKPKTLFTDHPITAYKQVAREQAQASFAYRSCPLKTAPEKLEYSKVRIIESVPLGIYGPAYASIAPLADTPRREVADRFVAFLMSEPGRKLLAEYDIPPVLELKVFVPCGMIAPFFELRGPFESRNPELTLDLQFDNIQVLSDRLLKGHDVPDVNLSIGKLETDLLVTAGQVEPGTPIPFGMFRLALCAHVSKASLLTSVADLVKPEIQTIVLTSPETSSVGAFAKAALQKAGIWDQVQPRITWLPTIKDCHKAVSAGKADASFAYVGCPLPLDPDKAEYSKVKTVQVLSQEMCGGVAIAYASIPKAAAHPAEAARFIQFLSEPEARQALTRIGLVPVP